VSPEGSDTWSDLEADKIERHLTNGFKGNDNAFSTMVIQKKMELTPFDQPNPNEQYQMNAELRREIYTIFGVPIAMAGDAEGTSYQNPKETLDWFFVNTIAPLSDKIADYFNEEVMPFFDRSGDYRFRFDTSEFDFISTDDKIRSEVASANYQSGFWTQNEARTYTKMDVDPAGDTYIAAPPQNTAPELPTIEKPSTPRLPSGDTVEPVTPENAPEAPQKAVQGTPEDELAAWSKVASKNWQRNFEPIHLRGDFAEWLSEAVKATDGQPDAIKYVFIEAKARMDIIQADDSAVIQALYSGLQMVSIKAYADTKAAFVADLLKLFQAAVDDETNRRNFAARMRSNLNRYGLLALRDGLNEAGADPEALPEEALRLFKQWRIDQSRFVTNLGNELFKGAGITENEVSLRANMWADISLNDARLIGIEAANADTLMEWVDQPEGDHCKDCPRLDGTVLPISEWRKAGLTPGSGKTQCKQGCHCGLHTTTKKRTGSIKWLTG
jgi:hypothetical protein